MRLLMLFCFCLSGHISYSQYFDTWMNPLTICTSDKFSIQSFHSNNSLPQEDFETCIKPFEDISIIWLRFTVSANSDLAFNLIPNNIQDDLDFALFESNKGMPGNLLRCMATGILLDRPGIDQSNCRGMTGLSMNEKDNSELPGCSDDQNNFVSYVANQSLKEYFLLITNYNSTNGFTLEWGEKVFLDIHDCSNSNKKELSIEIHPNPTVHTVNYVVHSETQCEANLFLLNSAGNILRTNKHSLSIGKNSFSLSLNDAPGIYYLFINGSYGIYDCQKFELLK